MTIPKEIRDRLGLTPGIEMTLRIFDGAIFLEKTRKTPDLSSWRGYCGPSFEELGYSSVDEFIESARGR